MPFKSIWGNASRGLAITGFTYLYARTPPTPESEASAKSGRIFTQETCSSISIPTTESCTGVPRYSSNAKRSKDFLTVAWQRLSWQLFCAEDNRIGNYGTVQVLVDRTFGKPDSNENYNRTAGFWKRHLHVGDTVDASKIASPKCFLEAVVVAVEGTEGGVTEKAAPAETAHVRIHFKGCPAAHDESIPATVLDQRIAPVQGVYH